MISNSTPDIAQAFDPNLLKKPIALGDNAGKLYKMYKSILEKSEGKITVNGKRKSLFEELKHEFEKLYAEAVKKEKENTQEKIRNKAQEPFYYIKLDSKSDEAIFKGLKYGATYGWHSSTRT